jgi:carboxymethylenebutenolidase
MAVPVTFWSKTGRSLEGVLAQPRGEFLAGGILVLHEWWGINGQIQDTCDRFAEQGFLALAPDLYHGKRPETPQHASRLAIELDRDTAINEIDDAAAFVRAHPRCNGKVAVAGFCLGGAFAFGCARRLVGIEAAVPFYGIPLRVPLEEYSLVRVPIQAHFARNDDWAKVSDAENIQRTVRAANGRMDLFVYDAGHAFMRSSDRHVYDAKSATLAWGRAVEFLRTHLDGEHTTEGGS